MKRIFISYSHKDEKWKDLLVTHLNVLHMQGEFEVWDDRRIQVGEDWYDKIKTTLNNVDAAILLISADFLNSAFIIKEEIPVILQRPELSILYIMGLFDRPAEGGAIKALREKPTINGLTTQLQNLTDTQWQYTLEHLRDLNLLAEEVEQQHDTPDCHPLVREYFGEELYKNNPNAWKEAHTRLYEYYKNIPQKEYPDTFKEMEPLYAAVQTYMLN